MSDAQWYYAQSGQAVGPMTREQLVAKLPTLEGERTLVYGPGVASWTEARNVAALGLGSGMVEAPPPSAPRTRRSDEIDYQIVGDDMQFVDVELDPGETVIADAGAMMYMTTGIQMQTVFGDPSQQNQGFFGKLMSAGKRVLTGESLFLTTFSNGGVGKQKVAFAAPFPGKILPMDLSQLGGELICQKESMLCAAKGVSIGIAFQKKLGVGLFGGEGFILQRLTGDGIAFVHAGGTICQKRLVAGESLKVDTGCIVAFQNSVSYDIQFVGGIKNTLFGGEGLFFALLTGPGDVWLQSLPFNRLADRIISTSKVGSGRREEGSVLGAIGGLLDGDGR